MSTAKAFISYSHADTPYLERLKTFLKPMMRAGLVDVWDDNRIKIGQKWRVEIEKALQSARIAIFLASADSLASDFIDSDELPPLLEKAEKDGVVILSVIVGYCQFSEHSLSQYQAANDPKRPLCDMPQPEQDKIWLKLADRIKELVNAPAPNTTPNVTQATISSPQSTSSATTGSQINEGKLQQFLEGLIPSQQGQIIVRLNASPYVPTNGGQVATANALLDYARGTIGPGIPKLVDTIVDVFGVDRSRFS